ncbi:erythromycin esterase family protein [Prosthecobacter sp.]|uniref:erythromycin esterase family protein n=1 Tax=Prosthecobacter sp. TaxID=1965333 RepID=UPI002AB92649|nr:erythromycin esterase family protein [Prosthecobacter sp.]MDZ4403627.1 erythromycin esterase family protein [Prosthecobacter sp.]
MHVAAQVSPKSLVRAAAHPLREGEISDYDPLLDLIGDARFVLLGEASHGTHEFYRERAQITKRLITEKGFTAVAVEADFPDASRVNRYVRGMGDDMDAIDSLGGFKRFPAWMWRNADVLDFVGWLRAHNDGQPKERSKTGFYGLDLYSMNSSMAVVLGYLDKVDPEAAARARARYACFDSFGGDTQRYGFETARGHGYSCEDAVVSQFVELYSRASELARLDGRVAADDFFMAEQNARLVKNAEQYYRTMYRSDVSSWNLRDTHMVETLVELERHLTHQGRPPKIVVWAHNSHLGDARATAMGHRGEWNVGQLMRQRYGAKAVLVGFTTHHGTVTASSDWGGQAERKCVRPALHASFETLFHEVGLKRFLLLLREDSHLKDALRQLHLERAIGVIYRPDTERQSHYFHARLSDQFDAVIHFDETRAVEPLERTAAWEAGEVPETFPSGI